MSEKTRKMILIKDGIDLDIFDDKNMSDRVLMLRWKRWMEPSTITITDGQQ